MEQDYLNIESLSEIPDKVDGYPAPTPPKGRKADIFDIKQYTLVDERAKKAPEDTGMTWDRLITYLFKDLTTDLQKLRALFSWFGEMDFLDPTVYKSKYPDAPPGSPYTLLAQTTGPTAMRLYFAHLCRQAGLPCVVLRGYSKRIVSYSVGDKDVSQFGMNWTSVYVDGSWRLIDPGVAFLGTIYVAPDYVLIEDSGQAVRQKTSGESTIVRQKNENLFLMDPDENIYNDFPEGDQAWQLLDEPWSLDKFLDTPYFCTAYFQSAWKLGAKHKSIVEAPKGICYIAFDQVPEGSDFMYRLYFNESKSKSELPKKLQLTNYIISVNKKSVYTRLPVTGIYKLEILDQDRKTLCEVRIDSTGDINNQRSFPDIPEKGFGVNQEAVSAGLVDASRDEGLVIAKEGEKVCFRFRTRKPLQVQARLVHKWLTSQKLDSRITQEQEDDILTIEVTVPYEAQNPEFSLQINAKEKDSDEHFVNVLNYLLTDDKDLVYAEKGRKQHMHDELTAAIAGQDLHRLESALKEFRLAGGGKQESKIATEAYEKLNQLHQNAIQEAITTQKEEKLRTALDEADQSMARYFIHRSDVYGRGQNALRRLRRLSLCRHEVKKLSARQVSEVQSYNHPNPSVAVVVEATFVLLVENVKKLKKWSHVQTLLRRHGKKNIFYLIENHDIGSIDKERMTRASVLLDTTSAEQIRSFSIGAAAFYAWSKAVVETQAGEDENTTANKKNQDEIKSDPENNNNDNNKIEQELEP